MPILSNRKCQVRCKGFIDLSQNIEGNGSSKLYNFLKGIVFCWAGCHSMCIFGKYGCFRGSSHSYNNL